MKPVSLEGAVFLIAVGVSMQRFRVVTQILKGFCNAGNYDTNSCVEKVILEESSFSRSVYYKEKLLILILM